MPSWQDKSPGQVRAESQKIAVLIIFSKLYNYYSPSKHYTKYSNSPARNCPILRSTCNVNTFKFDYRIRQFTDPAFLILSAYSESVYPCFILIFFPEKLFHFTDRQYAVYDPQQPHPLHPTTVTCTTTDSISECLATGSHYVHPSIHTPYSSVFSVKVSNFFPSSARIGTIRRSTRKSDRNLHLNRVDFRMFRY